MERHQNEEAGTIFIPLPPSLRIGLWLSVAGVVMSSLAIVLALL